MGYTDHKSISFKIKNECCSIPHCFGVLLLLFLLDQENNELIVRSVQSFSLEIVVVAFTMPANEYAALMVYGIFRFNKQSNYKQITAIRTEHENAEKYTNRETRHYEINYASEVFRFCSRKDVALSRIQNAEK